MPKEVELPFESLVFSGLNTVRYCPAAHVTSDGQPDASNDGSRFGRAVHDALEARGRGEIVVPKEFALEHGVDEGAIDAILERFTYEPRAEQHEPEALWIEERVAWQSANGWRARGRSDVAMIRQWRSFTVLEVIDYKSGDPHYAEDPGQDAQVIGYALAWLQHTAAFRAERKIPIDGVLLSLAYVRDGDDGWRQSFLHVSEFERAARWLEAIVARAVRQWYLEPGERQYGKGDHCGFCKGRARCPARKADVELVAGEAREISAENVLRIFQAASFVQKAAEAAKAECKAFIEASGPVPTADGLKQLEIGTRWMPPHVEKNVVKWAMQQAHIEPATAGTVLFYIENAPKSEQRYLILKKTPQAPKRTRGKGRDTGL